MPVDDMSIATRSDCGGIFAWVVVDDGVRWCGVGCVGGLN